MQEDFDKRDWRSLLNGKIYAEFGGRKESSRLGELCLALLAEQKETWPLLCKGYASIGHAAQRRLDCDGFSVLLQHNPGRIKSTLAAVGEKDINKRPCFLCLPQLPREQKTVLYRNGYLILSNPMPVFPAHFTIATIDHRPQSISGHVAMLMQLMADFGYGWTILYNGPKCGASAPDHFHFQAVSSGHLPVEQEIMKKERLTISQADDATISRAVTMGREIIIIEGGSGAAVARALASSCDVLKNAAGADEEPMMNVIGFYEQQMGMDHGAKVTGRKGLWRLLVFPRRKHRPDAFFKKGPERIAVSPAAVEMGGIFVTPFRRDFKRLNADSVEAIYREVSLCSRPS